MYNSTKPSCANSTGANIYLQFFSASNYQIKQWKISLFNEPNMWQLNQYSQYSAQYFHKTSRLFRIENVQS